MTSPRSSAREPQASARNTGQTPAHTPLQRKRARLMLGLLFAICIAPVAAAYFFYYVDRPAGGQNAYGHLIEPQRPVPADLMVRDAQGNALPLSSLKGKWVMLSVDTAACDKKCVEKLYYMRQIRVLQGNERNRVETVWLLTDDAPVSEQLQTAYQGTTMWRADPIALASWLPSEPGTGMRDHIYLIDPLGNLMMAFPKNPAPEKIKHDLSLLLKWSGTG